MAPRSRTQHRLSFPIFLDVEMMSDDITGREKPSGEVSRQITPTPAPYTGGKKHRGISRASSARFVLATDDGNGALRVVG